MTSTKPMRIMTVAGTRPELIRLAVIIKKLDAALNGEGSHPDSAHILVWTGQNYTPELKDIFFEEFQIREPDYWNMGGWSRLSDQLGGIFQLVESAMTKGKPDKALILGDTNSALSTIICERLGVPVYHMEAGNRCHDMKVPEEVNRRLIDHTASYAIPYTPGATENLLKEGVSREKIFECGNPIYEVIRSMGIAVPFGERVFRGTDFRPYFLSTFHRQENVDVPERLSAILEGLNRISQYYNMPVKCSIHPRTRARLKELGREEGSDGLEFMDPVGFKEFLGLEMHATGVLTDSGTVQEECCLFNVPTVTIRDSTERPETVECGSNLVSGLNPDSMVRCMREMILRQGKVWKQSRQWTPPGSYLIPNVSDRVLEFLGV